MTTPLPPQPPHDDDALPGEAELKALYGRLPRHEPGPALDAAVLRAAAQAVQRPVSPRGARWPVALGTAATLVLAAGLVWQMRKLPADVPVSAPAVSTHAPVGADRPTGGTADAVLKEAERAHAPVLRVEPARPAAPAAKMIDNRSAVAPPTAAGYAAPTAGTTTDIEAPKLTAPRINPSNVPAAKSAVPMSAPTVNPTMAPAPPSAPSLILDRTASDKRADAAAPTSAPPTPPAPESAPTPGATPAAAAPVAIPRSAASSMMQRLRTVEPTEQATPAMTAELQAIRALFDHGHDVDARTRLEAFHRQHPHVDLPHDLRQRLDGAP